MKPAAGEAMNATASAISSGTADRRIGAERIAPSTIFAPIGSAASRSWNAVCVTAGETQFTRIPSRATSRASDFENATTPALAPA